MSEGHFAKVSRGNIVAALLGEQPEDVRALDLEEFLAKGPDELGLLYADKDATEPSAIVVRRESVADFFAWLETYAPQFSPITQTCRVILPEAVKLYMLGRVRHRNAPLIRALSGVVVGEVLAQTAHNPMRSLEGATLAHAQATFSLCLARAELLRDAGLDYRRGSLRGLEALSAMGFVPDRIVAVEHLFPFWTSAFGFPDQPSLGLDLVSTLSAAVNELSNSGMSHSTLMKLARFYEPARDLMMLQTYSAEDRVRSFDRLINGVGFSTDHRAQVIEDFCLAYAAVEIGGGSTRHAGLLQEHGERRPLVWLWFGLLSSLGEGDKWHPAFARLGKLVERELQYSFDPWDPPRADIAIDELLSIKAGTSKAGWMMDLPRSHARSLSVEVAPGVSFQFSFGSAERKGAVASPPPAIDVGRLDQALSDLWSFRQSIVGAVEKKEPQTVKGAKRGRPARAKKDDLF